MTPKSPNVTLTDASTEGLEKSLGSFVAQFPGSGGWMFLPIRKGCKSAIGQALVIALLIESNACGQYAAEASFDERQDCDAWASILQELEYAPRELERFDRLAKLMIGYVAE